MFSRFGLILEAYCRGQGSYLKHLKRQVEALDKLIKLTDQIKSNNETQERRLRSVIKPQELQRVVLVVRFIDLSAISDRSDFEDSQHY